MADDIDRLERQQQTLDASYIRGELPATEFVPARLAINSQLDAAEHMTDDDAPDIPPALSKKDWGDLFAYDRPTTIMIMNADSDERALSLAGGGHHVRISDADDLAALIALANEMLRRFDDPRAFSPRHVWALQDAANIAGGIGTPSDECYDLADALSSMLRPEEVKRPDA